MKAVEKIKAAAAELNPDEQVELFTGGLSRTPSRRDNLPRWNEFFFPRPSFLR